MSPHPLVAQLRFTRSEFVRCTRGIRAEDAVRRFEPMNCISWTIGHLANQEHAYWVLWAQAENLAPDLNKRVGFGQSASTPPLEEMWAIWRTVTGAADTFLDTLKTEDLKAFVAGKSRTLRESVGTLLYRNIYHYWFHTGEAHAIRQLLGHPDLPQFVGNMSQAAYRPES